MVDADQNEETFGIRMQKSRESKGWTIEKLANTLSVTENIVADYENGKAEPDAPMANRIAYVLDVSVYYLLFGSEYCLKYGYAL